MGGRTLLLVGVPDWLISAQHQECWKLVVLLRLFTGDCRFDAHHRCYIRDPKMTRSINCNRSEKG